MTRSKIQKMKFFIFLLIFVLAQTALCDGGSFRERREAGDASQISASDNGDHQKEVDGGKQQPADKQEKVVDKTATNADVAKRPTNADGKQPANNNRTQQRDDITSSSKTSADLANKTAHTADKSGEQSSDSANVNAGALVRGFLVFLGLSILVIAYMVFRSFRLSKTRAQLVRKYGVLTHRQDVEMRPLPLEEEDDEDTTVFDASNVVPTHGQHA